MKNIQRGKQRQRMRNRFVWLLVGTFIISATIVTTIVINTIRMDHTKANDHTPTAMRLVEEEEYVTDFSIEEPVNKPENTNEEQTICFKKIKPMTAPSSPRLK